MRSVKHSMMRRRRWLPAAFCLLCCLLFSGCTPGATVDSLLKPPSLSKEQQQIYLALQDAVGSGITLQYPRAGANLSAFTVDVPEAIEDAKVNSALNGIDNTVFYAGDMKDVLNDRFIAENGRPDVVILDPPRAGIHEDVARTVLRAAPQRIVYVSCNPATQARDIAIFDADYRVTRIQPVDMFPHTHHVENVVQLVRR